MYFPGVRSDPLDKAIVEPTHNQQEFTAYFFNKFFLKTNACKY